MNTLVCVEKTQLFGASGICLWSSPPLGRFGLSIPGLTWCVSVQAGSWITFTARVSHGSGTSVVLCNNMRTPPKHSVSTFNIYSIFHKRITNSCTILNTYRTAFSHLFFVCDLIFNINVHCVTHDNSSIFFINISNPHCSQPNLN